MNKLFPILGLLAVGGLAVAVTAANAPDKLVIAGIQNKESAVEFPHKLHVDSQKNCTACHHTWDGQGVVKKCTDCHTLEGLGNTPKGFAAFHSRRSQLSCVGCHAKLPAGHKAPTKCVDCHPKN